MTGFAIVLPESMYTLFTYTIPRYHMLDLYCVHNFGYAQRMQFGSRKLSMLLRLQSERAMLYFEFV